jgi:poly-gamma-glutamate synthesis protein (capsule biosynthesis protein)
MDKYDEGALDSPDFVYEFLKPAGFDILNHATNHVLDCGSVGLLNTLKRIKEVGALPLGTGENAEQAHQMQVLEREGMKIGFLGYLEECNWVLSGGGGRIAFYRMPEILMEIEQMSEEVDMLIVSLHADLEFRLAPSVPRVENCRAMAEAGADLILCHHPHVPQGIERYEDTVIAYSMGNFIFEIGDYQGKASEHTYKSTIHSFSIEDGKVTGWGREHFKISTEDFRPTPLSEEETEAAVKHAELIDSILSDPEKLRETWYESCMHYMVGTLSGDWNNPLSKGPENFVENNGWRYLGNAESRNWVLGILEMCEKKYAENCDGDFEYVRPNFPFQKRD